VAGFIAEFCALGGRVLDRRWQLPATPLAPTAAKVLPTVDGVALITSYFDDPLAFAKTYARVQPDLPKHLLLGPQAFKPFADAGALKRAGPTLNGVVASMEAPYDPSGTAWVRFRREYARHFPGLKVPAAPADFLIQLAYYDAVQALIAGLEHVDSDLSGGERRFMAALGKIELDSPTGPIRLDRNRQAIAPAYLGRIVIATTGKPVMRTLRVLPGVEQTFGGYFTAATPPPTRTTPACRRAKPPPWAGLNGLRNASGHDRTGRRKPS
jgi:ABC-type branched-subunit amino acid transport system substrate-binding protein